jgi:hypothetical protein
VYFFLAWIAVEDLIRKYLGNNVIIYFAKDCLAVVLYLSFFIARRSTLTKPYRIGQVSTLGVSLVSWRGHEYFLFDRGFVYSVQKVRALTGYAVSEDSSPHSGPAGGDHELPNLARRGYWTLRRIAVALSVWAEPLFEKVCPGKLATHGVFLFRKEQTLD